MLRYTISVFLFLMFIVSSVVAQIDDDYLNMLLDEEEEEVVNAAFKPVIGISEGIFTFIGDVHDNYNINPYAGRYGTKITISRNLSRNFDFNLFAIFGKLTGNSRSYSNYDLSQTNVNSNLNFETSLFVGGVNFSYNFHHLLKRQRPVNPYISIGIETFEFSSKGDLQDENDNDYYYWSDGQIRNVSENSNNIATSRVLQRDYHYETDLRDLSEVNYSQFGFSIPIDIGFEFTVTNRMIIRIGNSFNFTNSDYIDNIKEKNGLFKNDAFLFSYVGFEFDLFSPAEDIKVVEQFKNVKFTITDNLDSDNDGVDDFNDECPNTPSKMTVDYKGCPYDEDQDGIPDYLDKQNNTPKDAVAVGTNGIRIIDTHLIAMLYEPDAVPRREVYSYYESIGEGDANGASYSGIPDKFKSIDINGDKYISVEELQKAIDSIFDFSSNLGVEDINELREFFFQQK